MNHVPDEFNPYQAPTADPGVADTVLAAAIDSSVVKKFRDQIVALGAFWMIVGMLLVVVTVMAIDRSPPGAVLLGLISAAWLALGVFTCLKRIWAVYVGLVLSYLNLVGIFFNFNICGILMFAAVIIQAHRVIKWARQIQAAGLPLDIKP